MKKVFTLGCGLSLLLAMSGCLNTARTPYNEVGLFSGKTLDEDGNELATPPKDAVSLWPFYLSDGRASYYLWPLIKNSPGCFAFLPFYNYDHGVHDIALLCTLSPKTSEYRLFPFYWQSKDGWMLFPLVYSYGDKQDYVRGLPLILNLYEDRSDWGCFSVPFFAYESDKRDGDYAFWSLPYTSFYEQSERDYKVYVDAAGNEYASQPKDVKTSEETRYRSSQAFYRGSGLFLYGHWRDEKWKGKLTDDPTQCKDYSLYDHRWIFPLWWRGQDESGDAWHHAVPLWWSWYTADEGQQNRLLFPFFFSRTYDDASGAGFFSPLVGWGRNDETAAHWWYALMAGASQRGNRESTAWCLPFYWGTEETEENYHLTSTWTLFGGRTHRMPLPREERNANALRVCESSSWHAGFLLPFLGFGSETPYESKQNILMGLGGNSIKKYSTILSRTGEVERYGLTSSERFGGFGLIYHYDHYESPIRRTKGALPVEFLKMNWGIEKEGNAFTLLAGLYHTSDVTSYNVTDLVRKHDIGIRRTSLNLGWLLWNHSKTTTVGDRLEQPGFVNNITEGFSYRLLSGLWNRSVETQQLRSEVYDPLAPSSSVLSEDTSWCLGWSLLGGGWETRQWQWDEKTKQFDFSTGSRRGFYHLLFRHNYQVDVAGERVPGNYKTGILLDAISVRRWTSEDKLKTDFNVELLWEWLADYDSSTTEGGDTYCSFDLLLGIPYEASYRKYTTHCKDPTTGEAPLGSTRTYDSSDSCWGLLFDFESSSFVDHGYHHNCYCEWTPEMPICHPEAEEGESQSCMSLLRRDENYSANDDILLGILYHRVFDDSRVWSRASITATDEALVKDVYSDDRYTFFGIPYQWHGARDGSYKHNSLWGLLFDQTVNVTNATETFGILGFLYRYNQYKDGSETRFIFPFITTASNEKEETWSFGFVHKLFRIEKKADGTYDWWLFWL
ncbi:MAG: hypothetical protein Q4F99_05545 [bacterium]|nr:hypothetical protein [bacterium]